MEYSNVNPPNILTVSVGAAAPQHGRDASLWHKLMAYIAEDPVITTVAVFTLVSVCLLSAGTNSAASGGVDSIYIAVSVVAILLTLSSGIAVVVCSYSRLLPGLICTAFFLCGFAGCLDLVVVLLEQLSDNIDRANDMWRVGGVCCLASQVLLFLASIARHCALRRLPLPNNRAVQQHQQQRHQHQQHDDGNHDDIAVATMAAAPATAVTSRESDIALASITSSSDANTTANAPATVMLHDE